MARLANSCRMIGAINVWAACSSASTKCSRRGHFSATQSLAREHLLDVRRLELDDDTRHTVLLAEAGKQTPARLEHRPAEVRQLRHVVQTAADLSQQDRRRPHTG